MNRKQISAMRQALYVIEAWDRGCERSDYWRDIEDTIIALRQALAEEQKPAEGRDWSLLEATQESLREHMAEIKRLRELLEKQPAAPAITYEMAMCFLEVALRNVELVGERGPMRHEIEQAIAAMLTAAPEQKGNCNDTTTKSCLEFCVNDKTLCPLCGEGHVTDHVDQMETEYKGRKGLVASHYQLCDACGSDFAGAAEMRANKRTLLAFRNQVDGFGVTDADLKTLVYRADELRRLHEVNAELLEALQSLLWYVNQLEMIVYSADDDGVHEEVAKAKAVIAKATRRA